MYYEEGKLSAVGGDILLSGTIAKLIENKCSEKGACICEDER